MSDHGHGHGDDAVKPGAKDAYRKGSQVFWALAVLTVAEFIVAAGTSSASWMFAIGILKTTLIVTYFMNIGRLWNDGGHH